MSDEGLARLRRWARLFDSAFRIPGTQISFGIDPILGLIPGIGDLASPVLSLFIIWHAARLRVPRVVLVRMVLNALIDAGVGAIPVLGDAFDFAWKANDWNLSLLERHAIPGGRARGGDWLFVIGCMLVLIATALVPLVIVWSLFYWIGRSMSSL
ncbi:MAG TPA: DUF4112 domain-containing protein [Vicinamibacterales bacterium]|nr:DUF4112 domain-containing protein [Vicinamibacterales bacterium]